jgi:hypothetical protein
MEIDPDSRWFVLYDAGTCIGKYDSPNGVSDDGSQAALPESVDVIELDRQAKLDSHSVDEWWCGV